MGENQTNIIGKLLDHFPGRAGALVYRIEQWNNESIWIDLCSADHEPGNPETDVARVRLEVWDNALWLRAWRGQHTECDPYLNECLYRFGDSDGKEETQ